MAIPPPVPPVPDLDRYAIFNLAADSATINVPFPIYGSDEDITVTLNGTALTRASWSLQSASGTPIAQIPLPLTDAYVLFAPVCPAGSVVEIIGSWQPRQASMPTAPGIARREFNQITCQIVSAMREFRRQLGLATAPVAMHADASGSLAARSSYDGAAAGFVYLQTDDAAQRPIFYVKNSAASGDWSQALIVQENSLNASPVLCLAYASPTPVTLTGTIASTTVISNLVTFASGTFINPSRTLKVRVWGNYKGQPFLSVRESSGGFLTTSPAIPPNASGSAVGFDAEFTIDAVTPNTQVGNSSVRCGITPFYGYHQGDAGAVNFAGGSPVQLDLAAQLTNIADVLNINRAEAITT